MTIHEYAGFCPQCVIASIEQGLELEDEPEVLHNPMYKSMVKFILCDEHKDKNLFTALQEARQLTEHML